MVDEVRVPEGLPRLSQGSHGPGEGRACVMELVSVLAGETWSDHPKCVHPLLAEAAILVNDRLRDQDRHLLVPHIGRFFSTKQPRLLMPLVRYFSEEKPKYLVGPPTNVMRASYERAVNRARTRVGLIAGIPCSCPRCGSEGPEVSIQWLSGALDVAERVLDKAPLMISESQARCAREAVLAH
jgi:hypothetical protein